MHYRSSPRERPLPERGWSSHEGLRRRVEATLSSVASELHTIGYTIPNFAPRGESRHHPTAVQHAGNPRWPAPPRIANPGDDGAIAGRGQRPRVALRNLNLGRSDAWLHMLPS